MFPSVMSQVHSLDREWDELCGALLSQFVGAFLYQVHDDDLHGCCACR